MGLFSFVKSAGQKVGLIADDAPAAAAEAAPAAADSKATHDAFAAQLTAMVNGLGLDVKDLAISYAPFQATVSGMAATQADREKIVLAIGNTMGVATVDDQMSAAKAEPPAVFHKVSEGDTLSKISLAQYGIIHGYDAIFEANKPMLKHPDAIFPGQVLRIPPIAAPVHVVASGETLGSIAKHWYGKPARYADIFKANSDQLDDPNKVEVGMKLQIPVQQPA